MSNFRSLVLCALSIALVGSVSHAQAQAQAQNKTVTHVGTFIYLAAVGGESTGRGLQLADGTFDELDFTTNSISEPSSEGVAIEVTGFYQTVFGIEIPQREVLVVQSLKTVKK